MREYKESYIAYLDLLGFKNTINQKSCEEIAMCFDEIEQKFITTVNSTQKPLFDHKKLRKTIMSDSVCFVIDANVKNAFAGLIAYCNFFQVRLARLKEPILLRGAIVKGQVYKNKSIIFGPGLVEAYLLEEKTAKFPRIIFTKSLLYDWKKYDNHGKDYVSKFTYIDQDEFGVVDYLYLFYGLSHDKSEWKNFAKYVQFKLDTETDSSIRDKFLYVNKNIPVAIEKYMNYLKNKKETGM